MRRGSCVLLMALLCGCSPRIESSTEVMMGTFVEVSSPDPRAAGIVFAEMRRIEKLLSKYDPQSEVSRLNAQGSVKASPDTVAAILLSRSLAEKSGGAFDISVAGLVDAWGFKDKDFRVPDKETIARKLRLVGSDKIIVNEKDSVVQFVFPGMAIDLGGIAKGFAVDRAVEKLKAAGITSCLINAGGQVYALGLKGTQPWVAAVRLPRGQKAGKPHMLMPGTSISTSGDYEQYFTVKGKRYSHIIDPRTGSPARSGIIAVTVEAPSAGLADGLSTAVFVLGREKGEALVAQYPGAKIMDLAEGTE